MYTTGHFATKALILVVCMYLDLFDLHARWEFPETSQVFVVFVWCVLSTN